MYDMYVCIQGIQRHCVENDTFKNHICLVWSWKLSGIDGIHHHVAPVATGKGALNGLLASAARVRQDLRHVRNHLVKTAGVQGLSHSEGRKHVSQSKMHVFTSLYQIPQILSTNATNAMQLLDRPSSEQGWFISCLLCHAANSIAEMLVKRVHKGP